MTEIERDAERYRWLLRHARMIQTDKQWMTMPIIGPNQQDFTGELIDAAIQTERKGKN